MIKNSENRPELPLQSDEESKLKHALRKAAESIKELIAENEELKRKSSIAIIGMACRFPGGASTPDKFWNVLSQGIDAVIQAPASRWNAEDFLDKDTKKPGKMYTAQGGFLQEDIEAFDAQFFGITPNEARSMDPQHRLLLEVSLEAFENAYQVPEKLKFSKTGVYIGISGDDYALNHRHSDHPEKIDAYSITGSTFSTAAGRLSYIFGLQGPCMALDTACSSSLVAIHQAIRSLQTKESDLALAGAVNLILHPAMHIGFSKLQAISPDGRCKTFDASANGYVRSEGCAMVVLKRLEDAERDGDRILGVIKGSAINQDGKTNGLAAPNGNAQKAVIQEALATANLSANSVDYVETHGTGTILGDPIEVEALSATYGKHRDKHLLLGSVKTNIGHLEPVAGMAGLIKILLSLQHEQIPKNLHFNVPNPHIPWDAYPIKVINEPVTWKKGKQLRSAGLSSFGFSGTNAHLLISEYVKPQENSAKAIDQYEMLNISAQDPNGLRELALSYINLLKSENTSLRDLCYSASVGRHHWTYRLSIVCKNKEELTNGLQSFIDGETNPNVFSGQTSGNEPNIAFLFTGQGSQYWSMGANLYASEPVFRQAFDHCDEIFKTLKQVSIKKIIFEDESETIHDTGITQPALFSIAYALTQLWASWGIKPNAVMGHSVGEYAAACAAGIFSPEDGLRLITKRASLMQSLPAGGGMAAVFCSSDTIKPFLDKYRGKVELAAINSPKQVLASGDKETVLKLTQDLANENISSHILNVSHAFHSYLMDSILSEFKEEAGRLNYTKPHTPIILNLSGRQADESNVTSDYWMHHIRKPVMFAEGMQAIEKKSIDVFVEIGPDPILLGLARQNIARDCVWLASLKKAVPDQAQMYRSLAGLYILGAEIDWKNVFQSKQGKWTSLPNYPFQRKKHWQSIPRNKGSIKTQTGNTISPFGLSLSQSPLLDWDIVSCNLNKESIPILDDHHVVGKTIFAAASYISLIIESAKFFQNQPEVQYASVGINHLLFELPLVITNSATQTLQLALEKQNPDSRKFKIISLDGTGDSSYLTHLSGLISFHSDNQIIQSTYSLPEFEKKWSELSHSLSRSQIYDRLANSQILLGHTHQWLQEARLEKNTAFGKLFVPLGITSESMAHDGFVLHPGLLDSCFCLFSTLINEEGRKTYVPFSIESFRLIKRVNGTDFFAIARLRDEETSSNKKIGDIEIFDFEGNLIGQCLGIEGREVSRESIEKLLHSKSTDCLYGLRWQTIDPPKDSLASPQNIIFFTNGQDFDQHFHDLLIKNGHHVKTISKALAFTEKNNAFGIDATSKEQFSLLAELFAKQAFRIDSVVYGWGLEESNTLQDSVKGSTEPLIYLLQSFFNPSGTSKPAKLVLLTSGDQSVNLSEHAAPFIPAQSILSGLGKTIPLEYPEIECLTIDIDSSVETQENCLSIIKYVENTSNAPSRLTIPASGSLGDLAWQVCERAEPLAGEVEIEVHATGLNFKDVLLALHRVPSLDKGLGVECSGRVVKLGPGVTEFTLGQRVLAMVPGSLSRFICAPVQTTVSLPDSLDDRAAATIPITFLTAAYSLESLANIRPGERVLIHAATGGVGQAAIQIAQQAGAIVYATASQGKWSILKDLGVKHIFDSRTTDFEKAINSITNDEGVDVVLNSLRGEFTDASLRLLKPGGRFLEIGITDLRTPEQVAQWANQIEYFPIDLMVLYREQRSVLQALLKKLLQRFAAGELKPLPYQTYPAQSVESAFRTMQQAKHIGKVVIDMHRQTLVEQRQDHRIVLRNGKNWGQRIYPLASRSDKPFEIHPNGHYLIVGGLGGLGLLMTKNLIDRGARHLTLCGRSAPSVEIISQIEQLRTSDISITVSQLDILDGPSTQNWIETANQKAPVKGILFLAGQLHDGLLENVNWPNFEKALSAKTKGLSNVDKSSRHLNLDFFIAFSSLTSVTGSPGQANYVAANSFVDQLMMQRASQRLPGISINWGPWEAAGMAHKLSHAHTKRLLEMGIVSLTTESALSAFNQVGSSTPAQIVIAEMNWHQFLSHFPKAQHEPFYDLIRSEGYQSEIKATTKVDSKKTDWRERLSKFETSQRSHQLIKLLESSINKVIGADENDVIGLRKPLFDLGLDSLTAVELKNRLESNLSCKLNSTLLFDYPTIEALSEYLKNLMPDLFKPVDQPIEETVADTLDSINDELDDMSQDDLEMLLASKLKR